MIPYIKTTRNENTVECNADLVVMHNSDLILLSIVDISGTVKKVIADTIQGGTLSLHDRKNSFLDAHINNFNLNFKYKLMKHDDIRTHGIIYNENKDEYIFDWDKKGLLESLSAYLREKHYLPVTNEVVQQVLKIVGKKNIVEECFVYTTQKDLKDVGVWYIGEQGVQILKDYIENIDLDLDEFEWDQIESISDYLVKFVDPIKQKLSENVNVLYDESNINDKIFEKMKPFDGQIPIIQGGIETLKLKDNRFLYLAGEPGIGKTYTSTKINHIYHHDKQKHNYCTLVVAPTTTLSQWKEEIKQTNLEEVEIKIIDNTNDFIRFYNNGGMDTSKPTYLLVGKETFKLSYKVEHGINIRKRIVDVEKENHFGWVDTLGKKIEVCICPDCGVPLTNPLRKSKTVYFTKKDFDRPKKSNYKCSNCDNVLWQATYVKNRKTSVADFIKRKNIKFDSVIVDEIHESNNFDSIIGQTIRDLMRQAKKVILLSGTVTNGYASSIYNILFALIPNTLKRDGVFSKEDFVRAYGTLEAISKDKDSKYHITSRTQLKSSNYKEVEGINPLVFTRYFANNFIFAELDDIRSDLPKLDEKYIGVNHSKEVLENEKALRDEIERVAPFNASFYNDSIIKHYTNKPFDWTEIPFEIKRENEERIEYIQPINIKNTLLPKEEKLVEICKDEKSKNKKVWIYCDFVTNGKYTEGDPLTDRLKQVLENNGLEVFVLKSTVRTFERKEIIERNKDRYDVFISHPKLVGVGINMQWCTNYVFYSPSYHVNTVRQASLRGRRANSTEPNTVYHLYHNDGIELEIMDRFKLKRAESEAIENKFISDIDVKRTASSLGAKIERELTGVV